MDFKIMASCFIEFIGSGYDYDNGDDGGGDDDHDGDDNDDDIEGGDDFYHMRLN